MYSQPNQSSISPIRNIARKEEEEYENMRPMRAEDLEGESRPILIQDN
jgi:hypothetical protein